MMKVQILNITIKRDVNFFRLLKDYTSFDRGIITEILGELKACSADYKAFKANNINDLELYAYIADDELLKRRLKEKCQELKGWLKPAFFNKAAKG